MSRITGNGIRGSAKQKVDDAKNALNALADRHGFASCGSAIDWRY
ncbi:hypothetical protein [Saccharopolyspora shandongensis]